MNVSLSAAWDSIQALINGFIAALPRLILGTILVLVFYAIAKAVRTAVRKNAERRGEGHALELAIGRIAQSIIIVFGVLVALTVTFPSFTPANLISTLGIGGVAIGFAFKDIFQNFLAGLLILITRPFRVGDQIIFDKFEGTVEDIQTRATYIKTYDGRRVIIPNGELYTNSVMVNTAFDKRRWQYDVGIGYGDDIEKARAIMLEVLKDADDVSPDPKADVIVVALADSTVNLRARWWTSSRQADGLKGQDMVLTQTKKRLSAAGIDLPFPTSVMLFHDQTEETDGNRAKQREGWPKGPGEVPRSARAVRAAERAEAKANATETQSRDDSNVRTDSR